MATLVRARRFPVDTVGHFQLQGGSLSRTGESPNEESVLVGLVPRRVSLGAPRGAARPRGAASGSRPTRRAGGPPHAGSCDRSRHPVHHGSGKDPRALAGRSEYAGRRAGAACGRRRPRPPIPLRNPPPPPPTRRGPPRKTPPNDPP